MGRENEINCINKIREALNIGEEIKISACNCNIEIVKNIFNAAKPNPKTNDFPDFIFQGGSIEHFAVTSSTDNRKGSSFKIEENKASIETNKYFSEQREEFFKKEHVSGSASVATSENTYTDFSYLNFVESIKKHFEDHIKSLLKANNPGDVVFLIEQQDARMGIYVNDCFREFYLISKDKNLLQWFKNYANLIKYIVFIVVDSVEIIELSEIEVLIKTANSSMDIRGGRLISLSSMLFLDY